MDAKRSATKAEVEVLYIYADVRKGNASIRELFNIVRRSEEHAKSALRHDDILKMADEEWNKDKTSVAHILASTYDFAALELVNKPKILRIENNGTWIEGIKNSAKWKVAHSVALHYDATKTLLEHAIGNEEYSSILKLTDTDEMSVWGDKDKTSVFGLIYETLVIRRGECEDLCEKWLSQEKARSTAELTAVAR